MRIAALALLIAAPAMAQDITPGTITLTGVSRIGVSTSNVTPGLVTIGGKTVTATAPACKAGDVAVVTPSASLSLGVGIGSARVPSDGSVEINLIDTVALGVTLGSITVQILCFGP